MRKITDPAYLADQYKTSAKLNIRIHLHERFSTNPQGWFPWVFDQICSGLPKSARVLELGSGSGELWVKNVSRLAPGWKLTLSDLSTGMLQRCAARLGGQKTISWTAIDANAIPFERGCLDGVIANHMLYHVPDLDKALGEIRRVLKPGGRLFATTLGEKNLAELMALLNGFDPSMVEDFRFSDDRFLMDNGASQIGRYFNTVDRLYYPDSLHVTEAKPLVDYILSGRINLSSTRRAVFTRYIQDEMRRRDGAIDITKIAGIFIAC